jgi:hypothetical protein
VLARGGVSLFRRSSRVHEPFKAERTSSRGEKGMKFNPCQGKDHCTEGGTHCEGCGRSHEEIARTRELIGMIAGFAQEMDYANYRDFAAFVADKATKKVNFERDQDQSGGIGIPFNITR